jgi:hypothetical protein
VRLAPNLASTEITDVSGHPTKPEVNLVQASLHTHECVNYLFSQAIGCKSFINARLCE